MRILFWQLESQKYLRRLMGSSPMPLSLLPVLKIPWCSILFFEIHSFLLKGQRISFLLGIKM